MRDTRLERGKSRLEEGVRFASLLIGTAAVLRLLVQYAGLPVRAWLRAFLDAYIALAHPIVDYTIGLIPLLFGYHLLAGAKDGLVLYALLAGSIFRAVRRAFARAPEVYAGIGREPPVLEKRHLLVLRVLVMLWPLLLVMVPVWLVGYRLNRDRFFEQNNPFELLGASPETSRRAMEGAMVLAALRALAAILRELFYLAAVVAFVAVLGWAGLIGLPEPTALKG